MAEHKNFNAVVSDLERKNRNLSLVSSGIWLAGSVGGLVYAIRKKKSVWGKIGYWILGGMITGVPATITTMIINSKRTEQIKRLKNEQGN